MKSFISGILGGLTIIAIIFLLIIFSMKLHIYNVQIINPKNIDSISIYNDKIEIIKSMQRDGILLTPQEYTSNVISYYNTAITLLIFLFILFSFVSYFHLSFVSKEQIQKIFEEKIKDSKEMEKVIMEAFAGKADDLYASADDIEGINMRINDLEKTLLFKDDSENSNEIIQENGS